MTWNETLLLLAGAAAFAAALSVVFAIVMQLVSVA
jgi:hypothetical protein